MKLNKRSKYIINSNREIVQIHNVSLPNITFIYLKSRNVFRVTESYFEQALKDKRIEILTSKTKSKSYNQPDWLTKYFIERDLIIDAENRDKTNERK